VSAAVDLCIIGAGATGLSVAAAAATVGAKVVLIERARMGGECLYTGCVPSKALLAAARAARAAQQAMRLGIDAKPRVDFTRVRGHVESVIAAIAPHDSAQRFRQLGVEVIEGDARFIDPRTVQVRERTVHARRFVIASGSEPLIPQVPGLDQVPYFTNESIFDNRILPQHLVVLGGGPLGMELAQAHRRLGSEVTVIERSKALPKDDPELARPLLRLLAGEGIALREDAKLKQVEAHGEGLALIVEQAGQSSRIEASHLLIATGRRPRVAGLGLEHAGVRHTDKGIVVDARLRTTARGIFAAGDVIDGPRFTHVCSYQAGIVVRNALFHLPARVNYAALPWVTYTDPEIAQIGMTEAAAVQKHGKRLRVVRVAYADNDRAQAEGRPEGLLKVVAKTNGEVLGASIRGAHAGELAPLWVLAIQRGLRLKHIAAIISPYPGWSELNKAAAVEFFKPLLASATVHRLVRALSWLP
jgi:pyruvate/2-oxoglutarate dehydrogenase complex dihydrolipoamide dehydrogenase (E3) component